MSKVDPASIDKVGFRARSIALGLALILSFFSDMNFLVAITVIQTTAF